MIMPGMITMKGTSIFGNAPMIGVRRAADMLFDAIARCTSTKFVVQYPKDSTKPRPNTMPRTDRKLLPKPVRLSPGQECSCSVPPGLCVILSTRPCQPPTLTRPTMVSGSSATTITKNCSTSL